VREGWNGFGPPATDWYRVVVVVEVVRFNIGLVLGCLLFGEVVAELKSVDDRDLNTDQLTSTSWTLPLHRGLPLSDDERIDAFAVMSVRRGSKPPLPAGQASSRRRCSPQTVRKKSGCGP
jgi:hypothetical protein